MAMFKKHLNKTPEQMRTSVAMLVFVGVNPLFLVTVGASENTTCVGLKI